MGRRAGRQSPASSRALADSGIIEVDAVFVSAETGVAKPSRERVVAEDVLTLEVEGVGFYSLMWTPVGVADGPYAYTFADGVLGEFERPEALALALGFAMSEGLISTLEDLQSLAVCADNPTVVRIVLRDPAQVSVQRRNVVVDSSCGVCGPVEMLEQNALGLQQVPQTLAISAAMFPGLMMHMRKQQAVFEETGGCHAAAIFDDQGALVAMAEDLGRHNALDKAIGKALLQQGSVRGCGVVLSSRLSVEMVLKAIRVGLEVMVAVSAPTSLAIELAQGFGVTLCGFVRASRATIYSHPQRVSAAAG